MSFDVLTEIMDTTRAGVAARRLRTSVEVLAEIASIRDDYRPFREALARPGLALIAEHKRSSPSSGVIRNDLRLSDVVTAYERGGAAAISVLTEETRFGGALGDLRAARTASSLPILRKDFILDEYQVYEAAASGADAILLIVAALNGDVLVNLHTLAGQLGLATLVEVHNTLDLEAALAIGATTIGINNRNLSTLELDIETTHALLPQIPTDVVTVAESGFRTLSQLERLAAAGADAVLIGEALMASADIEAACRVSTDIRPADIRPERSSSQHRTGLTRPRVSIVPRSSGSAPKEATGQRKFRIHKSWSQRKAVVRVAQSMCESGFVIGTTGNVSARVATDYFLVTPSRTPYEDMRPGDLVLLDGDGRVVRGRREPSREWRLHADIYRGHPDVGGIVHTHSPAALAWTFRRQPLRLATEEVEYFDLGPVPFVPYAAPGSEQLAASVALHLADGARAVLLERHGVVGTGKTPLNALTVCAVVEQQAWVSLHVDMGREG